MSTVDLWTFIVARSSYGETVTILMMGKDPKISVWRGYFCTIKLPRSLDLPDIRGNVGDPVYG